MEATRPRYSDGVAGSSRKLSELEVLHCLERSATLLDSMLARGRQADGGLAADEWRSIAKNLAVVSNVLSFLGENVIPSLLAGGHGKGPLRQQAAWELLMRLSRQTADLQLHFRAASATLN